jgi:hypothetical protein
MLNDDGLDYHESFSLVACTLSDSMFGRVEGSREISISSNRTGTAGI